MDGVASESLDEKSMEANQFLRSQLEEFGMDASELPRAGVAQ